jgi:predicted Rossmann fold flavoprotein
MKIIIIGAGAAGLMCAALCDTSNNQVTLIDKNEKTGKKLFITGKGRCNITNACDAEEFMSNIITNSRFMYSSYNAFSNYDVMDMIEKLNVPIKVERGMRVFPESDKSSDVVSALTKACIDNGVKIILGKKAAEVVIDNTSAETKSYVKGVKLSDGSYLEADRVIVATGGLSYPSTGSTGDGYNFARSAGHPVTKCYPSLVAFRIKESFCAEMAGLSLKNVRVSINKNDKEIYSGFGEMLFTHTGVSGPLILTASSVAGIKCENAELSIDLKPVLDEKTLDERLIKEFSAESNKEVKNLIRHLLPASMVIPFLKKAGIAENRKAATITKEERKNLIDTLKAFQMTIEGLCGYNEAVITKGGVDVKLVNPKTMESKLCNGLYFIGEVLDLDALTGGFNLQIAWSTAAAAARALSLKKLP